MTDRPIIFSAPMVRALLDGRKSQTRRILRVQPPLEPGWKIADQDEDGVLWMSEKGTHAACRLPYTPGDRLYVREHCATWGQGPEPEPVSHPVVYAADDPEWEAIREEAKRIKGEWKVRPSIHMPRWASRLTLTVTDVRVQRLQEISEADAVAEGVGTPRTLHLDCGDFPGAESVFDGTFCANHVDAMLHCWQILHGPGAWAANPWVVAISFTVQHGNIDQIGGAA